MIAKVPGIPWRGEGDYVFVVQLLTKRTAKTVAEVPLWIKLGTPTTTAQAHPGGVPTKRAKRAKRRS